VSSAALAAKSSLVKPDAHTDSPQFVVDIAARRDSGAKDYTASNREPGACRMGHGPRQVASLDQVPVDYLVDRELRPLLVVQPLSLRMQDAPERLEAPEELVLQAMGSDVNRVLK